MAYLHQQVNVLDAKPAPQELVDLVLRLGYDLNNVLEVSYKPPTASLVITTLSVVKAE